MQPVPPLTSDHTRLRQTLAAGIFAYMKTIQVSSIRFCKLMAGVEINGGFEIKSSFGSVLL